MGLFSKYKLSADLVLEIGAFNTAGSSLNDDCVAVDEGDVSSLPAACSFIDEQNEIEKLIALYIQLVQKDAADLLSMQKLVQQGDSSQAGILR